MKSGLIALIICFCAPIIRAESFSMEQFDSLSVEDRVKAIEKAPPEMKEKLNYEHTKLLERARMGEDRWKLHEQERAAVARGCSIRGISELLCIPARMSEALHRKNCDTIAKSNLSEAERKAAWIKSDQERVSAEDRYRKVIYPELLALANTPEALALDEKAKTVAKDLEKRFPLYNDEWDVTRDDVNAADKVIQEFFDQAKRLKHLTPEEIKAEVDGLPDEEFHR